MNTNVNQSDNIEAFGQKMIITGAILRLVQNKADAA